MLGLLPTTVASPTVMTTLTEAALQAYLNHCGSEEASVGGGAELLDFASEPLAVMGAAMASAPELSLDMAIERCIAQQAPLSLRLLLALQLSLLDDTSSMAWMPAAVAAINAASRCGVPAAREFELLPLWFFVVDLVAHEAYMAEYSAAADALTAFSRGVQVACGLASPSAATAHVAALQSAGMQLAGRAVLLYLNHAVLAKQHGRLSRPPSVAFGASTPELRAQASALLKAPQRGADGRAAPHQNFFSVMERMLSSHAPVPLAAYKYEVVRTLLPMAPYLAAL